MNTQTNLLPTPRPRPRMMLAAVLLLAASALPARADPEAPERPPASKSESAGVAGGLAIGAAAGGPIGALFGAAAGGWLGDRMHREKSAHARTRGALAAAQVRGSGLSMHLMFRTDESRLRPEDEPLVAQFATLAATAPGARVHVTGFADPRGSAAHNAALAAGRAAQVAATLVAAGLPADRLVVSSETAGEVVAAQDVPRDLDGYAFQRRVTLRIVAAAPGPEHLALRR